MKLPVNVGPIDRIVRFLLGIGLIVLALTGTLSGPLLVVAGLVAAIALVTGAIGFCPLYFVLGISTAENRVTLGRRARA